MTEKNSVNSIIIS